MSFRIKNITLAALWLALPMAALAETVKTNPVTGEVETYANTFIGDASEWNAVGNWDTGSVPYIESGGNYNSALVTNKTVSTTTVIDGWQLRVGAYDGANINWNGGVKKIQGGSTGCWLTADETSSITIASFAGNQLENNGNAVVFKLTSANAGGITWSAGLSSISGYQNLEFQYYLGGDGTVVYVGDLTVNNPQVIKRADITLSGNEKSVQSKTLVSFTSSTKTFTADAAIKIKSGENVLKTVYLTSVTAGEGTTLTTDSDVGACELVQTSTGIVLYYVDGDPNDLPAATVYKPSININFTNGAGNGLTTQADVGLSGYEVPGTSWNNYVVANSTFSTVNAVDSTGAASAMSGVSVTISGTRGSYSCSSLTPSSNPLHGYIDENGNNPTPTVTVTGIPYYKYRVLVYHSTDSANVSFGYDTINGTNYTYENNALTEGSSAWGASGADMSANDIAEGGNVLVTEALSGSTLTVVGHRAGGASSARGCIAAIQIIEVKADVGANDLEIAVDGETEHTVTAEEAEKTGTVYLTGSGTLTLDGSAKISAATIDVGDLVTLVVNTDRLDATTFTGGGTVVYNNALPETSKGWTDSAWTGTVWIKNRDVSGFEASDYGNAGSSIRFTGVSGYLANDTDIPLELADDGETVAFTYNGGSDGSVVSISKLKGSGTFKTGTAGNGEIIYIADASDFSGNFTLDGKKVQVGGTAPTGDNQSWGGQILIPANTTATVASGKTWTANGGFVVDGTLNVDGTLASSNATKAVSGAGTVVFTGRAPTVSGDAWWKNADWTGTVQVKDVTNMVGDSREGVWLKFNDYGNSSSVVEMNNVTGWLQTAYTCTVPLKVTGTLYLNNGGSNKANAFKVGTLLGSGTISGDGSAPTVVFNVTTDWSGFTGTIGLNNKCIVFGETIPDALTAGTIYVSDGAVVTPQQSSGTWWAVGGIKVDGELRAPNLDKFGGGTTIVTSDNGVFTLTDSNNTRDEAVDYARITGTGTLRYEDVSGKWRALSQVNFPTGMICENNLSEGLLLITPSAVHTIGSLAGSGSIRSDYSNGNRDLTILQARNTTWSGVFTNKNDRVGTVTVDVGESSTGTLTLAGTQTHDNALVVNAAVNLSGTWKGNTTVNGTFGGTGVLDGDLTFNAGAYLKVFDIDADGLNVSNTVTCLSDDSKIKVDLSAVNLEGLDFVPLLSNAGLTSEYTNKFELVDTTLMFDFVVKGGILGLEKNDNLNDLYNDSVTFTLNNVGSTIITDYILLVRISEKQLPGFSYLRAGDGSELTFVDGGGSLLNYDVDVWNPLGESLVWVKVPKAVDGNTITLYWSLKDGKSAPANNNRAKVWSNYAGVWHMDDAVDASGNSANGALHANSVKRNDGKFGGAYGRTENGVKGPIATMPQSKAMNDLTNDAFTVSAWVRLNADSGLNYPYFFSRKDVNASNGWGVQLDGHLATSSTKIWPDGTSGNSIMFTPAYKANDWVYMSVVLANGSATMFVDGVQYGPTANASFVPATDTELDFYIGGARADDDGAGDNRTNTLNGDMDEVRLYKGAASIERAKAEYANIQQTDFRNAAEGDGVSFLVPSTVVSDGKEYDYWLSRPTISPKYWSDDARPAADELIYVEGVLRSGAAVTNWCENLLTHDIIYDVSPENLRNLPVGSYCMYCARKDTENVIIAGEKVPWVEVDFTIAKDSGKKSVGDTASGRILLMNNDFSQGGDADIGGQGYSDTNATDSVFWEFPDGFDEITSTLNPMPGTNSILWSVSDDKSVTNKLWHLVSSRHGNTYPSDGAPLDASQNYLPWSASSYSITNGAVAAQSGADAGQILMLNTTDAMVYSPCYTNGIGTIYFDAVNGWTNNPAAYQLIVEYATNTLTGASIADENLWQKDELGVVTNWYGNLEDKDIGSSCWHPCKVNVAQVTGGNDIDHISEVSGPFTLAVASDSPTTGEFYRVYAPLDIRNPVRFRIRRVSTDGEQEGIDAAYLLLDNIIVSYPAMGATLSPTGWYDPEKKGLSVLGFESAFTKPFPVAGDDTIYGRAHAEYYVNSATALDETNFVASAKMHYRWRYLSKKVSEWNSVELDPENDFLSVDHLILPDEIGDVEFWYEYVLQVPYYSYVDYTGLPDLQSAFTAKYTEAKLGPQTNRADVVLNDYPTGGTDWFVRLRRNSSDYEAFKIHFKTNANDTVSTVDMSLVGKGTWRGFVPTQIALADGLLYRIEGRNPQTGEEWQWSTNYLSAISTGIEPVVASIYMSGASDTNNWDWAAVECDAATGYLMFQLDERTLSLTITHADYQNINKWHDAHDSDGSFVGSSIEDEDAKKSGTSSKTRDFSEGYDTWPDWPLTKAGLWEEAFEFPDVETATSFDGKNMYEPFDSADTLNQWKLGPGMWVYSRHYNPNYADHWAFQMRGNGAGYMMFTGDETDTPYGIGSVSFKARLAQPISLDTMSYDDAASRGLTNYTFFSFASLNDGSTDNFDGDASVSVLAYYTPQKGCYEFRVTQNTDSSLMLSIYRWTKPGAPTGKATLLAQQKFDYLNNDIMKMKVSGTSVTYGGLFISCSNAVDHTGITAGILRYPHDFISKTYSGELCLGDKQLNKGTSCSWIGLVCEDDDKDSRLKAGRYGVTSKNCPAIFWNPRHWEKEVTLPFTPSRTTSSGEASYRKFYDAGDRDGDNKSLNSFRIDAGGAMPSADAVNSLQNDCWAIDESRFVVTNFSVGATVNRGLAARTIPQKVAVEWAPAGKTTGFTGIVTNEVVSYTMKEYTVPVYLRNNATFKLQMVGSDDDARADVAIDNVSFTQFRGGTMGGRDADYVPDDNYGYRTNFYFSSCWMTNGMAKMSARRTLTNDVCAIRSPLMDGIDGRGIGLGMFSFEYKNAQTNTTLILQIATNITTLSVTDYNKPTNSSLWQDVTNFTFTADTEDLAHGTRSCYLGLHGVKGMMRLIVDPAKVDEVASYTDPTAFGEIDIESVLCRDEPVLDERSWWGWNIRTLNSDGSSVYDDGSRTILQDYGTGLSLAINNSVLEDTKRINGDPDPSFKSYMPFVQTPTFTSNIVGEVSFVARRFDNDDEAQFAEVTLYGAKDGNDSDWEILRHFTVSNTIYETYTYQIQNKSGYSAFRLAVTGVDGIDDPEARGRDPEYGEKPVRVMIDEIAVFEAVWPSMGFRYVYPFRTKLDETGKHEGVVDSSYNALMDEQPLAGERWTVQAEIFAKMLPDELDLTTPGHEPKVLFYWYPSDDTWGWKNWKSYAKPVELALADDETMVFRGSVPNAPDAIVSPSEMGRSTTAQYMAEVVYWTVNGNVLTNELDQAEWAVPSWYGGFDRNDVKNGWDFSPYTILDTIAPKRVWFNEVNLYDGVDDDWNHLADTNQYVELAVPKGQSITDWYIEYVNSVDSTTNTLCTFGSDGVSAEKSGPSTNGYVFITVQCPKGELTGYQADGKWSYDGELEDSLPIALRLVRPTGVVEQEIVLEGTNGWAGTIWGDDYSVVHFLEEINSIPGHNYYDVGNEYGGGIGDSLGVTNGIGAVKSDWTSPMRKTPGEVNVGQVIPEDYVIIPNGLMLEVASRIGALGFGHITQTFGTLVESTADTKVMTMKGEDGTNIVYTIDKWWEIASLTTNNVEVALTQAEREGPTYKLTVGAGASNDISVVVSAQPLRTLREDCGITEDNKYADAVMAWLAGGVTQRGGFAGNSITNAYFKGIYSDNVITNLTLTDRYWLDIDPTEPGWVLRGGIVSAPEPTNAYEKVNAPGEPKYEMVSSMKITIKMMITNECDVGECASAGKAYAPYVLRGRAPDSQSASVNAGSWTSVTFKVTGDIQNGKANRIRWVPLRRFVFAGDGKGNSTSFDSDFQSVIEIYDPTDPELPGSPDGWSAYRDSPVFYCWAIDDRDEPNGPLVLEPTNTLSIAITP